jgi:hypothetical protein
LDSDFHKFFFQKIEIQIFDYVGRSLNIGVNEAFMNVAFSLFETNLTKFKGYFHVSCLIDDINFGPIVPVSDFGLVLDELFSGDCEGLEINASHSLHHIFESVHFSGPVT